MANNMIVDQRFPLKVLSTWSKILSFSKFFLGFQMFGVNLTLRGLNLIQGVTKVKLFTP